MTETIHRPPQDAPPIPEAVSPAEDAVAAVEDTAAPPVPVDNPKLPAPGITDYQKRPVIASWMTTRRDFLATARLASGRVAYASFYHGLRTPWYTTQLTAMAPRGACRFIASTNRWVWDREAAPLRDYAVRTEDVDEYLRLARLRAGRVRLRLFVTVAAAVFGLGFALWLYVMAPAFLYAFAAGGVLILGFLGQQPDAPVIGPAVLKTEVQKLTGSIVLRGLDSIGNAKISAAIKKGGDMDGMHFTAEIARSGPGYEAHLDLPYGVVPEDVMDKREALASGLRRKLGCVWPSGDPDEHQGRLVLYVGDRPMNEEKKPPWPLLKSGQVDLFQPVVFGNDQRMRWVTVTLMFASVVIGSIPRMGKTFLLRLFLLIAALDSRSELHAFEFKGTGDFGALEPVCHRYRSGEEDEDIEYVLAALRELKEELRRRAKVIKALPRSICPESALDECQKAFEHPKYGAEIEEICTDIAKRGPALGIIGMFATQRPDAKSLPPGISANAVLRFCLKVMGWQANDMVLGDGMYKAGVRATMFSRSDLGICWMAGEGDDPRIVSGAFIDATGAEQVVARARTMREDYGNITGHAIGQGPEDVTPEYDLLVDVLQVVPADEERVWNERVAARLNLHRPEVYGGWRGETVTITLKPLGVTTKDVAGITDDGKRTTRRGIERADIVKVVAARNGHGR
ncbi:cell division protein FtsK [Streptomyces albicerus]|uniref:cell division protein FtsK n=1 Tax=Streptomyces albicerus TaxID=2569859 RepID=UPI00124AF52C|nr:cell division protein FtsK [Streptomyces albicerus]